MAETMTPVNLAAFDVNNDTDRLVLADLLAVNDRKQEEALCRETATRLAVDDGRVIRALRLEVIAFLKEVGEPHGVVVDPVTRDPAVASRVRLHYLPIAQARPDAAKRARSKPCGVGGKGTTTTARSATGEGRRLTSLSTACYLRLVQSSGRSIWRVLPTRLCDSAVGVTPAAISGAATSPTQRWWSRNCGTTSSPGNAEGNTDLEPGGFRPVRLFDPVGLRSLRRPAGHPGSAPARSPKINIRRVGISLPRE